MQDLDKEMEAVQAAALAADQGDNAPAQDTPPAAASAPAPASPEQTETSADSGEAHKQQPEPSKETPPTPPEGQKPDSAFTKAQKEKARREKTWADINAEKERLAAKERELEERSKRFSEEQHRQRNPEPTPSKPKYSAEEYEAVAEDFDRKGEFDLAATARATAKQLREEQAKGAQPQRPEQGPAGVPQVNTPFGGMPQEQFMAGWQSNLEMLSKAEPDLANKDSELGKTTAEMLRTYPLLSTYPTGIRDAVGAAKLTIQARRVPVLEKELAATKAELERLNKTNSLRGGPPGMPPAGPKSIEDMSLDEAEAAARAAALAADQG